MISLACKKRADTSSMSNRIQRCNAAYGTVNDRRSILDFKKSKPIRSVLPLQIL